MRDLKAERIREMTEDEILAKIVNLKEELFNLRFRNQMRQLQNPLLLREKKRDVARLHTILAEHKSGIRSLAAPGLELTTAPKAKPEAKAEAKPKTTRAAQTKAKAKGQAKPAARAASATKRKAKKA